MRYFVHRVENLTQGENRTISGHNSLNEAREKFYESMRDDIRNANVIWANVFISNQYGVVDPKYNDYYEAPEPESES